jgi:hypothetical protein
MLTKKIDRYWPKEVPRLAISKVERVRTPTPSHASECLPPTLLGVYTRLRERGCGVPIRTRGQILWYSRCTYVLCVSSSLSVSYRAGPFAADPPRVAELLAGLQQVPVSSDEVVPAVPVKVAAEAAHLTRHAGRHRQLKEAHSVPEDARSCNTAIVLKGEFNTA